MLVRLILEDGGESDAIIGPAEEIQGDISLRAVTVYCGKIARYMQFLPLYGAATKY